MLRIPVAALSALVFLALPAAAPADVQLPPTRPSTATSSSTSATPTRRRWTSAGKVYATQAALEAFGCGTPHGLPNDGFFAATPEHPRAVLAFAEGDDGNNAWLESTVGDADEGARRPEPLLRRRRHLRRLGRGQRIARGDAAVHGRPHHGRDAQRPGLVRGRRHPPGRLQVHRRHGPDEHHRHVVRRRRRPGDLGLPHRCRRDEDARQGHDQAPDRVRCRSSARSATRPRPASSRRATVRAR